MINNSFCFQNEQSGATKEKTNTKTGTSEDSNSNTKSNAKSKGKTEDSEHTNEQSDQRTNTTTRTYTIRKVITVPRYSAVKISSYAYWANDITVPFKLNIKFTAKSWRRSTDGEGINDWRTLDYPVVEYLMNKHNFPGKIIRKSADAVYGQITCSLKSSVGLESVFSAKEINLNEEK
jgi:hypothetical protein